MEMNAVSDLPCSPGGRAPEIPIHASNPAEAPYAGGRQRAVRSVMVSSGEVAQSQDGVDGVARVERQRNPAKPFRLDDSPGFRRRSTRATRSGLHGSGHCRTRVRSTATRSASDLRADALAAFANRLAKNARHWGRWARRRGLGAYRVYDRDQPEFPLAIDCYVAEDPALGMRVHLQEIETGWEQTDAGHAAWLSAVRDATAGALALPATAIAVKERRQAARPRPAREDGRRRHRFRRRRSRAALHRQSRGLSRHRAVPRSPRAARAGARARGGTAHAQPVRLHRQLHRLRRGGRRDRQRHRRSVQHLPRLGGAQLRAERPRPRAPPADPRRRADVARRRARRRPPLRPHRPRPAGVLELQGDGRRARHPARPRCAGRGGAGAARARRRALLLDQPAHVPARPGARRGSRLHRHHGRDAARGFSRPADPSCVPLRA